MHSAEAEGASSPWTMEVQSMLAGHILVTRLPSASRVNTDRRHVITSAFAQFLSSTSILIFKSQDYCFSSVAT